MKDTENLKGGNLTLPDEDRENQTECRSVFVIDDDPQILDIISSLLEEYGYAVSAFQNCTEASDAMNEGVDIVLTDIRMPDVSGMEILDCAHRLYPEMPVLLMSGHADFETVVEAIKKGAFDFITKPINPDLLLHSVDRAVNYSKFRRIEKKYRKALEYTVEERTMEIHEMMDELKKARDEAFEVSRQKSEFCSTMSRKMETPLLNAREMLRILSGTELNARQKEYLARAVAAVDEMGSLLETVMGSSMFQADEKKSV